MESLSFKDMRQIGHSGKPELEVAYGQVFEIASAFLIAPFLYEATSLQIGTHDLVSGEDMPRYDSEVCLANAGRLLVAAGTTQPNFARTGPVESKMFLHQVSQTLQAAKRTALEESFVAAGDINSRARFRSAGGVGAQRLACLLTSPALCFEDDCATFPPRFGHFHFGDLPIRQLRYKKE